MNSPNPDLRLPEYLHELWTADQAELTDSQVWQPTEEDETPVACHVFTVKWKGYEREIRMVAHVDTSLDQIEDAVGAAVERELDDIERRLESKSGKIPVRDLSSQGRKEVAAALREWKRYAKRRLASSNRKIYYSGIQDVQR